MSTVGAVPTALIQNSTLKTKIASVFEKMRVFSPITTVVRAKAWTLDVPTISTSVAKNHSLSCKTSIGTATPGNVQISLNNKTDLSVDYCEDEFMGDEVGFKALIKEDILAGITLKLNTNFTVGVLAGATVGSGTIALGTAANVHTFMADVALIAANNQFRWKPSVEHGSVIRAKYNGQPFVIADSTAFKAIRVVYDTYKLTATGNADDMVNMFKSPEGVWVINSNTSFADQKQMIFGIAGAPIHAYRDDKIKEFDREISSFTTAGEDSGDLLTADAVVEVKRNMGAEIWNTATVPTPVKAFVTKQKMT